MQMALLRPRLMSLTLKHTKTSGIIALNAIKSILTYDPFWLRCVRAVVIASSVDLLALEAYRSGSRSEGREVYMGFSSSLSNHLVMMGVIVTCRHLER